MIPLVLVARGPIRGGGELRLMRRGHEFSIMIGANELMNSRRFGSEEALATLTAARLGSRNHPRILIGGLGMGFTLRAVLDLLPARGRVVVAELMPAVVEWNRGPLAHLADYPLKDPRVQLELGDVAATLRANPVSFDAVLLDVDNGPTALTAATNARLYDNQGVATARAALTPNGIFAVWSARENRKFEQRLRYCGFAVEVARVRGRLKGGGPRHVIVLGHVRSGTEPGTRAAPAGRPPG